MSWRFPWWPQLAFPMSFWNELFGHLTLVFTSENYDQHSKFDLFLGQFFLPILALDSKMNSTKYVLKFKQSSSNFPQKSPRYKGSRDSHCRFDCHQIRKYHSDFQTLKSALWGAVFLRRELARLGLRDGEESDSRPFVWEPQLVVLSLRICVLIYTNIIIIFNSSHVITH